ncbi:hypothetical protein LXL04_016309 [Taraxacum kok-saghyz]
MARRSIDYLCTLSQPRNLINFPLYIYPFEDRGFRACGIDQKLWIFHRLDIMSFICFLYLYFFCTIVRSAEDAQLIEDVRSATKYGEKMNPQQVITSLTLKIPTHIFDESK